MPPVGAVLSRMKEIEAGLACVLLLLSTARTDAVYGTPSVR